MKPSKNLYVVHCVDAEGPLYESIHATFDRLKQIGIEIKRKSAIFKELFFEQEIKRKCLIKNKKEIERKPLMFKRN